ncbi:sigma-70 family RNA polymerase sigma factor [Dokdonia sinensis]|uniref:RNA polymerase sigma factor n=1 Tax=Dokdonia sinensis TaxID=2479847 RepID=A0A3M0GH89_9FLAO|nr:sigma-70 family RNA polymerase sigma factor [Dokdonia sinensis]RMB64030.1 sigma-70 family RNA polymerase sigma factor [Dokdonia sinensis]
MTHQDDQYFIDQTLGGDTQAFATLIERHKGLVFTLCLRMLKQREEAEEVAQDVFVKSFQKLSTFGGRSKFSTWLYRITYNRCLDTLSRKRNQPTHQAYDLNDDITADGIANVLEQMEAREFTAQISECIQELPETEAFLVTLFYLEEQSLKEIASVTGLKENHVKVKLYRSRKKLYEIITSKLPNLSAHYGN